MNCDRIARAYRWLEYAAFGRELERRRFRFIGEVAGAHRALILGDGDGRFLARFLSQSQASADCIDLSARMLQLSSERAGAERAVYRHGDALAISLTPLSYDLIVTHFFLDCFDAAGLDQLAARIRASACPGALWLISEFRQPLWAAPIIRGLYLFFRVTTGLRVTQLADHRPVLRAHGFTLLREETSWRGLLASELWQRS